jgi:polyphenol oxidase
MFQAEVANRAGKKVARLAFSHRFGGKSSAPFNELNLATHVGDSAIAVAVNRSIFADEFNVPADRITWPGLTHSADVGLVESRVSNFPNVDILMTKLQKQALATLAADCVQLVAVDAESLVVLTAHIGWQGAVAGALESLLDALKQAGSKLNDVEVWLGPAICGSCYQVPAERIAAVQAMLPDAIVDGGLDLRIGIQKRLKELQIKVNLVGGCNSCDSDYFSYRRDGQTGRQGALVMLV